MTSYDIAITPMSGNVIDGDVRLIGKVVVTRYDTPSKGVKAGATFVRAWTRRGLRSAGTAAGQDLVRRDKAKHGDEIRRHIERIERAVASGERVDLRKRVNLRKRGQ